jgi:hypothetical protein
MKRLWKISLLILAVFLVFNLVTIKPARASFGFSIIGFFNQISSIFSKIKFTFNTNYAAAPIDATCGGYSSSVPDSIPAGMSFTGSISMTNTGTTAWTNGPPQFYVYNMDWTDPNHFNPTTQALPSQPINSGSTVTFPNIIFTAPSTPGTYNMRWQMIELGVSTFGQICQKQITVTTPVPTDSICVGYNSVPDSVPAGGTFNGSITMKNTGTTAWTNGPPQFYIANLDQVGQHFTPTSLALPYQPINSGNSVTFPNILFTAPTVPGTYTLHWEMVENTVANFGEICTKQITVTAPIVTVSAPIDSVCVGYNNVPDSIPAGGTFNASITMKNTGTTPWTNGPPQIYIMNPDWLSPNHFTNGGGSASIALPNQPINTNQTVTFNSPFFAPTVPGTYNFRWQMIQAGVANFGQICSKQITVAGATPTPTPTPVGYTFCANEGNWCSFTGTKQVMFGANGQFNTLTFTDGVNCDNSVFGDPIYGTVKRCYYGNGTVALPTVQLHSNFLKNDSTAISIVNGTLTNYDIKTFSYVYGGQSVSTDNFAYRVVSAIRQLGYSQSIFTPQDQYPAELLLNKFERLNRLPITDIVTKDTLLKIDSMLVNSENLDNSLGQDFPLYSRMIPAPLNEPSKEHLARIADITFRALPSNLTIWSEFNFREYVSSQLSGSIGPQPFDPATYKYCESFYYEELGDSCVFRGNTMGVFGDDYDMAATFLHEYAHYLDANLYPKFDGTSHGIVDTTGFYNISYDTSNKKTNSSGWLFYPYRRGLTSRASEFVSSYATGWQINDTDDYFTAFEDFAESFALYIEGGSVFRELAKTNIYLQQKYGWLKQNVFGGVEYNTGLIGNIQLLKNNPTGSYGNLDFNVLQFAKINNDFVYSFSYPKK